MTAPNAELAYMVLDHIDAHPEQWDQGHWFGATECGTTACFAGWAVALAGHDITLGEPVNGHRAWVAIDGDDEALISNVAAVALGIDGLGKPCGLHGDGCEVRTSFADDLFGGSNTREHLGEMVAEIFGPRPAVTA